MFEVGKSYEIRMIIDGSESTAILTVEKYEHPLVKFADTHIEIRGSYPAAHTVQGAIVNITSPNFISATAQPPQ